MPAAPGAPWPLPQTWINSTAVKRLSPATIEITHNLQSSCDVVDEAFTRYRQLINLAADTSTAIVRDDIHANDINELTKLHVTVIDQRCDEEMYPSFGDNETCA